VARAIPSTRFLAETKAALWFIKNA